MTSTYLVMVGPMLILVGIFLQLAHNAKRKRKDDDR